VHSYLIEPLDSAGVRVIQSEHLTNNWYEGWRDRPASARQRGRTLAGR
jgi:hypothetical protein